MKKIFNIQVNSTMMPVKVLLTEDEAAGVTAVLKAVVESDPDALVEIQREDDGEILYGNYDEWCKTHQE